MVPKLEFSSGEWPDQYEYASDVWSWGALKKKLEAPHVEWPELYIDASALLTDDEDREAFKSAIRIKPDRIPSLKQAYLEFSRCHGRSGCQKVWYSAESVRFITSQSKLACHLQTFAPSGLALDGLYAIDNMMELEQDFQSEFPDMVPQSQAACWAEKDEYTLTVKLDAGDLRGYEKEIENILKPWSNYGLQIHILWTTTAQDPTAAKILVDLALGERAAGGGGIHLSPFVKVTTLVHEFGHVMGLPDEYYTYFSNTECNYRYYLNSGNVMSRSMTGRVLPSHIAQLRALYFSNFR
jgi:hypothetical protein